MQAGLHLVLTDTDVIWFRDPVSILHEYTQARFLAPARNSILHPPAHVCYTSAHSFR